MKFSGVIVNFQFNELVCVNFQFGVFNLPGQKTMMIDMMKCPFPEADSNRPTSSSPPAVVNNETWIHYIRSRFTWKTYSLELEHGRTDIMLNTTCSGHHSVIKYGRDLGKIDIPEGIYVELFIDIDGCQTFNLPNCPPACNWREDVYLWRRI